VPCLFELPTALLEYLDLLQGGCSPPALRAATPMWLWNMQYSGTALLLLVNPASKQSHRAPILHEKKTLRYQLCLTHYAAVQINNSLKRTFVIKVATMKITDDLMETITCLLLNRHFSWWTKMNGTQRKAMLSPWRTHCMYSGMAKGTSQAEATSKNQACSIELCKSEGIRQAGRAGQGRAGWLAGRQAVSQSVENSIK